MFWEVGVVSNVLQQRQLDYALRTWPAAQRPGLVSGPGLGLGPGLGPGLTARSTTDVIMITGSGFGSNGDGNGMGGGTNSNEDPRGVSLLTTTLTRLVSSTHDSPCVVM